MTNKIKNFNLLHVLIVFYVVGAGIALLVNGGNSRNVQRYEPSSECLNLGSQTIPACLDTTDYRTGTQFSWVSWQFMSDNQGEDEMLYFPIDILLIAAFVLIRKAAATRR